MVAEAKTEDTAMPGISLNEDCSHFFCARNEEELNEAHVDGFVDQYAGTQVRELVFNLNGMRTSYASQVWQPIWDGYDPEAGDDQPFFRTVPEEQRPFMRRWPHNAWLLHQRGIDPYRRWLDRSRDHGISAWLSMRMNDAHGVDGVNDFLTSDFWRSHPEYWRVPWRFGPWADRSLDYARKEVRDHHMLLVRELVERYDMDGLELDWMRFGYHFRPGHEEEGSGILTEFVGQVRELLDQRAKDLGHPVKLGVRVPSHPQTARALGMDAVEWAHRGLVDMIVVTPFWVTMDFDMPIELWRELLGGADVVLAAGLEERLTPFPAEPARSCNLEEVRGAAAAHLARGADRIYLFNYMDRNTDHRSEEDYRRILNEVGSLDTLAGKPRRHIVTFPDTSAPGEPQLLSLPRRCGGEKTAESRVHIGPKPQEGTSTVLIGIKENESDLEVHVNSNPCRAVKSRPEDGAHGSAETLYECDVPLKDLNPGYNVVEVTARTTEIEIVWLEVDL